MGIAIKLPRPAALWLFSAILCLAAPPAIAQTPAQFRTAVDAFGSKLVAAQQARQGLFRFVFCMTGIENPLFFESLHLEHRVGELVSNEKTLKTDVLHLETAYELTTQNYAASRQEVDRITAEIAAMPEREAYLRWERSCDTRSKDYSLYVCSYGNRNAFGPLARAGRELEGANRRLQIAQGAMNAEAQNLAKARSELEIAQASLGTASRERSNSEIKLAAVKRATSEVRAAIQPLELAIAELEVELAQAKAVDLEYKRQFTLDILDGLGKMVDSLIELSRKVVSEAKGYETCQAVIVG